MSYLLPSRYCPLNADGAHNRGASLTELKKKRNAAGSYSGRGVMLCQPLPREVRDQAEHPTVTRLGSILIFPIERL